MEPDDIRSIRRAADETEQALLRVVAVTEDRRLPAHQRQELDAIGSMLREATIKIGNMCDLAEADLRNAKRTP
jgi:hypothetical protein